MNKFSQFVQQQLENVGKAALLSYGIAWQTTGLGYDSLFTLNNLKAAVVGAAITVFAGFGLKNIGRPDSPNVT